MRKGQDRLGAVPCGEPLFANQIRMTVVSLVCEITAGTMEIVFFIRSLVESMGCRKRRLSPEPTTKPNWCVISLSLCPCTV